MAKIDYLLYGVFMLFLFMSTSELFNEQLFVLFKVFFKLAFGYLIEIELNLFFFYELITKSSLTLLLVYSYFLNNILILLPLKILAVAFSFLKYFLNKCED